MFGKIPKRGLTYVLTHVYLLLYFLTTKCTKAVLQTRAEELDFEKNHNNVINIRTIFLKKFKYFDKYPLFDIRGISKIVTPTRSRVVLLKTQRLILEEKKDSLIEMQF